MLSLVLVCKALEIRRQSKHRQAINNRMSALDKFINGLIHLLEYSFIGIFCLIVSALIGDRFADHCLFV